MAASVWNVSSESSDGSGNRMDRPEMEVDELMLDAYAPLSKSQVVAAIERRSPDRIPLIANKWWGEGLKEEYGDALTGFDRYPEDAVRVLIAPFDVEKMGLSWLSASATAEKARDAGGILPDWRHLDEFIEKLPAPDEPGLLDGIHQIAARARGEERYFIFGWWRLFFERPWELRGMENILLDYYEHPDEVHRLHDALCRLYEGLLERAAIELQPDGFWTSDDLGNQRQLMMSPAHFRDFLKPYYRRVGDVCRRHNLHFWLHSCGNNTEVLEDLVECGVDVFHPVQKHTMDEEAVAARFGDRITFLVGFDVQHILQEGSPDDVRREVRYLVDTFDRQEGGMCLAAGNGIVGGTPLANIDAFLDEAVRYGAAHRSGWRSKGER